LREELSTAFHSLGIKREEGRRKNTIQWER